MTGSFNLQDILFYGGCGFSIFRCMSFALENCEKKDGNYTFSDLLKYNFYLPFFFFGPIMTFDRYHAQVKLNWMWWLTESEQPSEGLTVVIKPSLMIAHCVRKLQKAHVIPTCSVILGLLLQICKTLMCLYNSICRPQTETENKLLLLLGLLT